MTSATSGPPELDGTVERAPLNLIWAFEQAFEAVLTKMTNGTPAFASSETREMAARLAVQLITEQEVH